MGIFVGKQGSLDEATTLDVMSLVSGLLRSRKVNGTAAEAPVGQDQLTLDDC